MVIPAQLGLDLRQCQRWSRGRDRYRPAGELFDPRHSGVEVIDAAAAKEFVRINHYSASFPASRLNVGIFLREPFRAEELCGVAVFSVPMSNHVIPRYFDGLDPNRGVELGRLVLLDKLAANAETWFLKRAFRALRHKFPEVRGVIAYSDPLPRHNRDGILVKKGHIGTVYNAFSGVFRGRSKARTLLLTPAGGVANERSLSKLRNGERGADGVQRDLERTGASARAFGESGRDWLGRLVAEGFLRPVAHPGNFCFSWTLR